MALATPRHRLVSLALLIGAISVGAEATAQTFVEGIDVAHYQGSINWTNVKSAGVEFAFIKATQGYTYVDSTFAGYTQNAAAAGVLTGFYHFTDFGLDPTNPQDPIKQANHFVSVIKPYYDAGLHLPPVADIEGFTNLTALGILSQSYISTWAQSFSDTVYSGLGVRPLIYSSKSTANTYYTTAVAGQHELWEAWWKGTGTTNPPVAADTPKWGLWQFWQYSSTGSVSGITGNVDRDVFNGTQAQLAQLLFTTGGGGNPGPRTMISDFNIDEGYFGYSPTYSGSNVGILAGTTIDRVTTQAYEGAGSQQIVIDGDPAWVLREVSGIGSPAANPTTNLPLPATGSVGFWLKTAAAGVSVQILIDDPTAANPSAIEGATLKSVLADDQWHLYEWAFQDAAQWNNWAGGGDGAITGATVSIDSIRFSGGGDVTLFMDAVSHNPQGSLLPPAGDFDHNLIVDEADLALWKASVGVDAHCDADGDGDTDGADLLIWQRHQTSVAIVAATTAAPEPTSLALALAGLAAARFACRRSV